MATANVVGVPDQAIAPARFVPAAIVAGVAPFAGTVTPVIAALAAVMVVLVATNAAPVSVMALVVPAVMLVLLAPTPLIVNALLPALTAGKL